MKNWKFISLVLALLTALFLCGIGISVAESSLTGILVCLFGAIMMPGFGFMLKKRYKVE